MNREFKLTGHNYIIDFSPVGNLIAVGGYDGSFKIYDLLKTPWNLL